MSVESGFILKSHRKHPIELQLTAMIDIFSMIVIFLIFGTVFGASEIYIPNGIKIPQSQSKEGIESAPRLIIEKNVVSISLFDKKYPLSEFQNGGISNAMSELRGRIHLYQTSVKKNTKETGTLLNVIADRDTPYRNVFDVIKVFREAGFQTMLFVSLGEAKSSK